MGVFKSEIKEIILCIEKRLIEIGGLFFCWFEKEMIELGKGGSFYVRK